MFATFLCNHELESAGALHKLWKTPILSTMTAGEWIPGDTFAVRLHILRTKWYFAVAA